MGGASAHLESGATTVDGAASERLRSPEPFPEISPLPPRPLALNLPPIPSPKAELISPPELITLHAQRDREIEKTNPQPDIWRAASVSLWSGTPEKPGAIGGGSIVELPDGSLAILTVKHVADSLREDPTHAYGFIPGLQGEGSKAVGYGRIIPAQFQDIATGVDDPPTIYPLQLETAARIREAAANGKIMPLRIAASESILGSELWSADPESGTFTKGHVYQTDAVSRYFILKTSLTSELQQDRVDIDGDICEGRSGDALIAVDEKGRARNVVVGVISGTVEAPVLAMPLSNGKIRRCGFIGQGSAISVTDLERHAD